MNDQQLLVLKILSATGVIKGRTKFVKIIHMVCKLLEKKQHAVPFEFKADNFGVNSTDIVPVLESLERQQLVSVNTDEITGRKDIALYNPGMKIPETDFDGMSSQIYELVKNLNALSSEEVIAISYDLFNDTTLKSRIKPEINQKIAAMYDLAFEKSEQTTESELVKAVTTDYKLEPQFNDMDARVRVMKSIGCAELPPIIPDSIDKSTGMLAKKYSVFKGIDLEALLEDVRRR